MNEGKKNITIYNAEDIKKYLEGSLSPAEMHALEKAALSDPFLADAIEGMQGDSGNFDADVTELRERLNNKTKEKKTKFAIGVYWSSAAVLLVVVTAIALILINGNKETLREKKVLAKVESKKDTFSILQDSVKPAVTKIEEKKPAKQGYGAPSPPVTFKETEKSSTVHLEESTAPVEEKSADVANNVQQPAPQEDRKATEALQGKAAGVEIERNSKQEEEVVVVAGYSAKRKETNRFRGISTESKDMDIVVPAGGWNKFDEYLIDNKKITGKDSLITGKEVISFTIDENGRPTNFKIRKSLSAAHDAEVTRLLQQGPGWEIIKGKKRKVKLEVIF